MKYELIKKRIKEHDTLLLELVNEERTYEQVNKVLTTTMKLIDYTRRYLSKCNEADMELQEAEELLAYYMEEENV